MIQENRQSSRRRLFKQLLTIGAAVATPMINRSRYRLFAGSPQDYSARAIELVGRSTVIDMLSPLSLDFPKSGRWLQNPSLFGSAEYADFKASGIHSFHIGVGLGGANAYSAALQFFGGWNSFIADREDYCIRIDSVEDLERAQATSRTGVMLGLQNSAHFRRPNDVAVFHGLGQRVSQLTYNSRNLIGSGATERRDGGLSDFGVAIVEAMNQAGMAVDVSHCGDQTTLDAFEISKKPVLITHSNCRALVPGHPRCKTDEAIRSMARSGGVMGITGVRMFVRDREPTTIEHFLDHFDHVAKLVGPEHLGVGSDIDLHGYDDMPEEANRRLRSGYKDSYAFRNKIDIEGVDHPRRMFDLAEGLIRRNYTDSQIEGILGGNFQRVLAEIWQGE